MGPVGLLALQGDFPEHAAALRRQGVETCEVRRVVDLAGLAGLVLPGGESTTMLRLLDVENLRGSLVETIRSGLPVLATCAGVVLLAREVRHPRQDSLDLLDVTVERNAYGRQIHSGTFPLHGEGVPAGAQGVFIRAPRIVRAGPGVEVLAHRGPDPVLVRQGGILAACFHPELEADHFVTRLFAAMLEDGASRAPRALSTPSRPAERKETTA